MIPKNISTSGNVDYKYKVNDDNGQGNSILNNSKGVVGVTTSGELINTVIDYTSPNKIATGKTISTVQCTISAPITTEISSGKVVVKGNITQTITYTDTTTEISTIPFLNVLQGCAVVSGVNATNADVTNVTYVLRRTKKIYVILKVTFTIKY